ncbi:MAG: phosphoglycerate kinase [Candidatus Xenolissoclinum pacificiensis L6]|uniref:Phosphoglycerate kinase n=1 Tax=Candidatus Xenolissoclinum pacificiensis L6 TaxID=1401685 RepID=W2V212_9RICK|nr:MAG: phosphoglycerate kinase [Candidatus Xenolissoclinum pacificiensis L6]
MKIEEVSFTDKVVLLRVDYNVPVLDGKILDSIRIVRSLQTIRFLSNRGAKVVLLTHFGKPKARYEQSLSLKRIVFSELQTLLPDMKLFFSDLSGLNDILSVTKSGDVILLENIRFYEGEIENRDTFSSMLASYADFYVNDAFSVSHRKHASVIGIPKFLPSVMGLSLKDEISWIQKFQSPDIPFLVIMGGAKVSSKLQMISVLSEQAQHIFVGGGIANSIMRQKGINIGKSLYENIPLINCDKIVLPVDVLVLKGDIYKSEPVVVDIRYIPQGWTVCDIGFASVIHLKRLIDNVGIVLWSGTLGISENEHCNATDEIASYIAHRTNSGMVKSIIGGGDTLSATIKYRDSFSYVSVAGSAFLTYIAQDTLPGIEQLL